MLSVLVGELSKRGLMIRGGAPGVLLLGEGFEAVVRGLRETVRRLRPGGEALHLPPVMAAGDLGRSGYLDVFPQLVGAVSRFEGDEAQHRELVRQAATGDDWAVAFAPSPITLVPAACYPVYPLLAARGPLGERPALFDIECHCFRCEPSEDPFRLQAFRLHEFVCVATPEEAELHCEHWTAATLHLAAVLGLNAALRPAQDPFFGRVGALLGARQEEESLKFELQVHVPGRDAPVACASFNRHKDKFARAFGLRRADGAVTHSACVGFGLERLALALFATHGPEVADWPQPARALAESRS